jgi:hypothetical protein
MSTAATKAFHQVLPPKASGKQQVISAVSGATAAEADLWTMSPPPQGGKVYVMFEAVTTDCYIRINGASVTPSITTSNGILIKAGWPGVSFWLNQSTDKYVEFIATGAGVLKWYVASPEYDGHC